MKDNTVDKNKQIYENLYARKEVYGCDILDEVVKNLKGEWVNAFKIDLNN